MVVRSTVPDVAAPASPAPFFWRAGRGGSAGRLRQGYCCELYGIVLGGRGGVLGVAGRGGGGGAGLAKGRTGGGGKPRAAKVGGGGVGWGWGGGGRGAGAGFANEPISAVCTHPSCTLCARCTIERCPQSLARQDGKGCWRLRLCPPSRCRGTERARWLVGSQGCREVGYYSGV
eukprot:COSAG02_NODE_1178_length_14042_cov_11.526674_9_plen_174_part_00